MIIDFSIENFRSFQNEAHFSMTASSSKNKDDNTFIAQMSEKSQTKLLRSAVVYGPNGSGKSNFIRSLFDFKWLVTHSMDFKVGEPIKCYQPFALNKQTIHQPVHLSLSFIFNEIKYTYQISFNEQSILSEILNYYPSGQPANLFKRFFDSDKKKDYVEVVLGKRLLNKKISKKVFNNQLYLSKFGSEIPHSQLTEVYKYFSKIEVWNVLDTQDINQLSSKISHIIADDTNKPFRDKLSKLIRVADTRIEDLKVKELDRSDLVLPDALPDNVINRFLQKNQLRTFARHKLFENGKEVGIVEFDLNQQESRGTKVLFALGGIILQALENGGIVVFDELDNSLHPKLCKFLVRLFNNPISNPLNAQLIFATHEVTLLDKDVFRKDQIWFTEKDKYGCSELYLADDIEGLREDTNFELWYRTGKLGGNPKIKEIEFIFD